MKSGSINKDLSMRRAGTRARDTGPSVRGPSDVAQRLWRLLNQAYAKRDTDAGLKELLRGCLRIFGFRTAVVLVPEFRLFLPVLSGPQARIKDLAEFRGRVQKLAAQGLESKTMVAVAQSTAGAVRHTVVIPMHGLPAGVRGTLILLGADRLPAAPDGPLGAIARAVTHLIASDRNRLTGFLTTSAFIERCKKAVENLPPGAESSAFWIEINGMADIHRHVGPGAMDPVIWTVSRIMREVFPRESLFGTSAGSHLLAFLSDCPRERASELAQLLSDGVKEADPPDIGTPVQLSVSVGVHTFRHEAERIRAAFARASESNGQTRNGPLGPSTGRSAAAISAAVSAPRQSSSAPAGTPVQVVVRFEPVGDGLDSSPPRFLVHAFSKDQGGGDFSDTGRGAKDAEQGPPGASADATVLQATLEAIAGVERDLKDSGARVLMALGERAVQRAQVRAALLSILEISPGAAETLSLLVPEAVVLLGDLSIETWRYAVRDLGVQVGVSEFGTRPVDATQFWEFRGSTFTVHAATLDRASRDPSAASILRAAVSAVDILDAAVIALDVQTDRQHKAAVAAGIRRGPRLDDHARLEPQALRDWIAARVAHGARDGTRR